MDEIHRICGTTLDVVTSPVKLFNQLITSLVAGNQIKKFKALAETEQISGGFVCPTNEAPRLQSLMKQKGVGQRNLKEGVLCVTRTNDDGTVEAQLFWNKEYDEQALDAIKAWSCEKQFGVVRFDYLYAYANGDIQEITGIPSDQIYLYNQQAEQAGVRYSLQGPEKGQYHLYYAAKDEAMMQGFRLHNDLIQHYDTTEFYPRLYQYREHTFQKAYLLAHNNDNLDTGAKSTEPQWIVNDSGLEMEVNENYLLIHENDKITPIYRKQRDFHKLVDDKLNEFAPTSIVILDKKGIDQYHDLSTEKRPDFLLDQARKQDCPTPDISTLTKMYQRIIRTEEKINTQKINFDSKNTDVIFPANPYKEEQSMDAFTAEDMKLFTDKMKERQTEHTIAIQEEEIQQAVEHIRSNFVPSKESERTLEQFYMEELTLTGEDLRTPEFELFQGAEAAQEFSQEYQETSEEEPEQEAE